MKSQLNLPNPEKKLHEFPVLARLLTSHEGIVVLFSGPNTGVVVATREARRLSGREESWISVNDSRVWERLPTGSSVTLTQE